MDDDHGITVAGTELILKDRQLPANIQDLRKFVLVGREKLVAVRAHIRAIDQLGVAKEVLDQKKEEARMLSEVLIDAEGRIGVLLREIQDKEASAGAGRRSLPENITYRQSSDFQAIAANPDIVEQVKVESREKGRPVTRQGVLRRIKEQEKEGNLVSDSQPGTGEESRLNKILKQIAEGITLLDIEVDERQTSLVAREEASLVMAGLIRRLDAIKKKLDEAHA